nr:acyl transferase [Bacteroidota bacterium]
MNISTLHKRIFEVDSDDTFNDIAVEIFRFQYQNNKYYRNFVDLLKIKPSKINHWHQIPFLPIEFFKFHTIYSNQKPPAGFFTSSGTTGTTSSRHYYGDLKIYEKSFFTAFESLYGRLQDFCVLALLPSYLERKGSSLIYMVEKIIRKTGNPYSGFFLHNHDELNFKLKQLEQSAQKTLLIGVSFALLDFIEKYPQKLKNMIIMETGGMKGRRREMIRAELHERLCHGFGQNQIHSEYGMTELFSQAYSTGGGVFNSPSWMKILVRDVNDPLSYMDLGKTGGINVVDLANIHSCSFIATQDLGRLNADRTFEVLGRFDDSDIRGCSLLIA